MKKAAWVLALVFGIAFLGATLMNARLINLVRKALSSGVLRDKASIRTARFHLAVVIPDTNDSFFRAFLEGISHQASASEVAIQVFRYPSFSPAEAERYLEIALKAKLDGLIIYTSRDTDLEKIKAYQSELAPPLKNIPESFLGRFRGMANGVVIISVGTDRPVSRPPNFIGSGSFGRGFEAGKRIVEQQGSSARIGLIVSSTKSDGLKAPEALQNEPIYKGVSAAIKAAPGASIVAAANVKPGILSGEEAVLEMLRFSPSINVLICSNSHDTVSAAQVIIDLNLVGKIMIVGSDETPEIKRYIEKGVVSFSIVRDSRRIGKEAIKAFSRLKEGLSVIEPAEAGFYVRTPQGNAQGVAR